MSANKEICDSELLDNVKMTGKFYDVSRFQEFGSVPFVIKRMDSQDSVVSYSEAVNSVEFVLEKLRKNNVPSGTGIAIRIAHHSPSSCVLILAILNHKCHFHTTDKMMLSELLKDDLCHAGIEYLITSSHMTVASNFFERVDDLLLHNEEYRLLKVKKTEEYTSSRATTPNLCYSITTTGTTGKPKLVYVPYECIEPNIRKLSQKLNISMADIIYLGTPFTFDPFVVELFLALYNGSSVLVSHCSMRASPSRLLDALLPKSMTIPGITVLQMTPSLFRQFGSTVIRDRILNSSSCLRVLILGGEAFPSREELASWMDFSVLSQKMICNIYGVTELSCWSTLHILKSLHAQVPLGLPISDEVMQIRNGELYLGSPSRRCYIPEVDDGKETDDCCFRATGDLVRLTDDGLIYYEGRTNDVVKRAGNRISLDFIAAKIQKHLSASELVTCLWEPKLQKLICCIRTMVAKTKLQQRAQTYDILSKLMAAEQPDRFVYVQHFPFNAHGKLDRKLLLKECEPLAQPGQEILRTFIQDMLGGRKTSSVKRMKKEKQLPVAASIFELSFRHAGGSSFHAITLSREIGMQMCIDDEQRHLFELLLNDTVPLQEIFEFLSEAKLVANITKLKPIEPVPSHAITCSSSGVSTTSKTLIITRIEQPSINFQVLWKVNFGKCVDSAVAQLNGRYICVGAHSKMVRTIDALTGEIIATINLADRVECKVTFISEQLAIVGCYDGCLYGFHPLTGEYLWRIELGGMIKSQPHLTSDGKRIVVCNYASDYNVMCFSTDEQRLIWCIRVGEKPIFATPLELPNVNSIIVGTLDGSLARIALTDGTVQWLIKAKEPIFSSPALLDSTANIILCAEVAGRIIACDSATGEIISSYTADGNIFSSLVLKAPPTEMGHTFLIFGCIDHNLYCLRCKSKAGKQVEFDLHWKLDVGAPIYASPILLMIPPNGHLVFCCATNGYMVLVSLGNGQRQWSDKLAGEVFSTPCYIESRKCLYVGCRDNYLYCLGM